MSKSDKSEPEVDVSFVDLAGLLDRSFGLDYFKADGGAPPAIEVFRRTGTTPLVVVVGENASGKSFLRRVVHAVCRSNDVECIALSMEGRRATSGFMSLVVYGDEVERSTGENSVKTFKKSVLTSRSREGRHVLFWDEPDVGLSDDLAAGMGVAMRGFASGPPVSLVGAFLVTHSRVLAAQLVAADPHYVHVGGGRVPESLSSWVERPVTPRRIDLVEEESDARWRRISGLLNDLEEKKKGVRK